MGFKIKKFFLLTILILLQSCSGGKIGNFLETSFKNIEEPKIKVDNKNDVKNKIIIKSEENSKKNANIEESKIIVDKKNDLRNKKILKSEANTKKNINIEEPKIKVDNKNDLKNKITLSTKNNIRSKNKIMSKNISSKRRKFQPQSYKIIFILKDVDPKDPIEELNTILMNSEVNFEIEKIERFFDSKNKITNKN